MITAVALCMKTLTGASLAESSDVAWLLGLGLLWTRLGLWMLLGMLLLLALLKVVLRDLLSSPIF